MDVKTLESLPFDVLFDVVKYIPLEDLVLSLQYVNKYWQSIIQDPALWRDITFKPSLGMNTDYVVEVLKGAPLLRSFEICEDLQGAVILYALCEYNPNIIALALDQFEANTVMMEKLVETYPDLEFLQLPFGVFMHHIPLLGKLTKLKRVKCIKMFRNTTFDTGRIQKYTLEDGDWGALEDLELCSDLEDGVFDKMMGIVRGKLIDLRMQTVYTGRFMEHVQYCLKLKTLKLNFMSKMHSFDYGDFFAGLKRLVCLKYLSLKSFIHTDVDVLCRLFDNAMFPSLTELQLEHCLNFNHHVAKSIVDACPKIKIISLKGCGAMDDLCLREFARCAYLTSLDISGSSAVTEGGLSYLRKCHRLKVLKLNWVGLVTRPMLEQIAQLKNLSNLEFDNTEINTAYLSNTVKQLPKLKLLSVYHSRGVDAREIQKIVHNCFVRYRKKDLAMLLGEQAHNLQSYTILGVEEETLKIIPNCKDLEVLTIDFLDQPCLKLPDVFTGLQNLRKLRALSIKGLVDAGGLLDQMLCCLPQLQELVFDHSFCVTGIVAVAIAYHCSELERLSLISCVGLDDDGLSAIVKIKGLRVLNIAGCISLTETGLLCLGKCENLQELDLSGVLSNSEPVDVLNCIMSLPKLGALTLGYNTFIEEYMNNKKWVVSETSVGETVAMYIPSQTS